MTYDFRVGINGQFVGKGLLVIDRVAVVFIRMVESEREVPAISCEDIGGVGRVDDKGDWVTGYPWLAGGVWRVYPFPRRLNHNIVTSSVAYLRHQP